MKEIEQQIAVYLDYCRNQKCLDEKTLKAYRIDLRQFSDWLETKDSPYTPETLEAYLAKLHHSYKPKTVKRKIATLKAFFHYLEYKNIIDRDPFHKVQVRFRSPVTLPKTIPLHTVESFLKEVYAGVDKAKTENQKKRAIRDVAVIELLFATGMRVSELTGLSDNDVDLDDGTVLIYGKGSRERLIQIQEGPALASLKRYRAVFEKEITDTGRFFVNSRGVALSDQSIRNMINDHARRAGISQHMTPHMFRHTFATGLLDNGVDIRYIQAMLGHSSINTTEIYTHVSTDRQRKILEASHPRRNMHVE